MQTVTTRLWSIYWSRAPCAASRGTPRLPAGSQCARVRPARPFSISASARAKQKPPPAAPPKPPGSKPKTAPRAPSLLKAPASWQGSGAAGRARGAFNPVVQRFARRASPQLLYQAPTMGVYVAGCYLIGAGCAAYVAINAWTLRAAVGPRLRPFVLVASGGVLLFVAGFGVWVVRKSFRLVRSVSAVPVPSAPSELMLQIESYRTLPWRRASSHMVPYEKATVTGRFYVHKPPETEEQRAYKAFLEEENRRWQREHIMTLPFRQAGEKLRRFFKFMRGLFGDDGFFLLRVKGHKGIWRLNDKPAWLLDEGKPIDALIKQDFR